LFAVKVEEVDRICNTHGEERNARKSLVRKSEGKVLLERPRHQSAGYVKIDVKVVGGEVVNWIQVTQDREQWRAVVNTT
jgi:hypothetical protein